MPEVLPDTIATFPPEAQALLAAQQQQINLLIHQLSDLKRIVFGKTSERHIASDAQLSLLEGLESTAPPPEPETTTPVKGHRRKKSKPKGFNGRFSPDIPREKGKVIFPESMTCPDCSSSMEQFRSRTCERLIYRKHVSYVVVQDELAVCRCPQCKDNIAAARAPKTPLEGVQLESSFLAHLVSEKLEFGLPAYRLEERLRQHEVDMSRGTIVELFRKLGVLVLPLLGVLEAQLKADAFIHMDESGWKVARQYRGKKKYFSAWAWIALGASGDVVLKYWESCLKGDVAKVFGDYEGVLVVDGKSHFDQFQIEMAKKKKEVILARCHAHARRKFEKALKEDEAEARWFMKAYRALFRRESFLNDTDKPPDERLSWRRRSRQVLELMKQRCIKLLTTTLPKSLLGNAVKYVLKFEPHLSYYATTGDIPISNNAAERLFRKFVIGRKNWLFSASEDGARSLAALYSLVLTCRQNGIPVFEYLEDIIHRLGVEKDTDYAAMLPRAWAAARQ